MKIVVVAGVFKLVRTCKEFRAVVTGRPFCGTDDRAAECSPVCDLNREPELLARLGTARAGIVVAGTFLCGHVPNRQEPEQTAEEEMRCSSRCV